MMGPMATSEGFPAPTLREFRLVVQCVSDDIEALSLIEQVLSSYPSVDRLAIGRYLVDRSNGKVR
jgi:hypothetical protein